MVALVAGPPELRPVLVGLLQVVADDLVGRAPAIVTPERQPAYATCKSARRRLARRS